VVVACSAELTCVWSVAQHFHYGYFLYAVSVVGKYRPAFVKMHKAAVMSIVRDIASPDQSEYVLATLSLFVAHTY
jgi:endoglucanase Acf2